MAKLLNFVVVDWVDVRRGRVNGCRIVNDSTLLCFRGRSTPLTATNRVTILLLHRSLIICCYDPNISKTRCYSLCGREFMSMTMLSHILFWWWHCRPTSVAKDAPSFGKHGVNVMLPRQNCQMRSSVGAWSAKVRRKNKHLQQTSKKFSPRGATSELLAVGTSSNYYYALLMIHGELHHFKQSA